jgi:ribonuclease HI
VKRATLYADGAARGNPGPAGSGAVLLDPDGRTIAERTLYIDHATNNVAEYNGLLIGLEEALAQGIEDLAIRMDSQLVVKQLRGEYRTKHANMLPLADRARALLAQFKHWTIEHVPREQNGLADALSNRAIDDAR